MFTAHRRYSSAMKESEYTPADHDDVRYLPSSQDKCKGWCLYATCSYPSLQFRRVFPPILPALFYDTQVLEVLLGFVGKDGLLRDLCFTYSERRRYASPRKRHQILHRSRWSAGPSQVGRASPGDPKGHPRGAGAPSRGYSSRSRRGSQAKPKTGVARPRTEGAHAEATTSEDLGDEKNE